MNTLLSKTIKDQEVVIDSQTAYINCKFVKCHLFYVGGDAQLVNCKLDNCQITITGDAGKVVQFMQTVGMIQPSHVPSAIGQVPESGTLH
ncbi:MAG: hypothetical protein QOK37_499 [Thermoanaerobaculia bacterium]|jgi:hypothetical protein|nr:hypothetical protein [Thermoanaerobaculia bacterium]